MQTLLSFVDIFLHVDKHLEALVAGYGLWVYGILFLIIFCETGLVVTAILPGDSLLFAAGSLCALGGSSDSQLSLLIVIPLLIVAAVLGDAVNYSIGKALGPGYLEKKNFELVILGIIFVSILPLAIEAIRARKAAAPKVSAAG